MTDEKKKMVIVMNCAGIEIHRYLMENKEMREAYDFELFTTYVSMENAEEKWRLVKLLNTADVLVSQNVKNVDWLRNDWMEQHIPKRCLFIRLGFWRFDGFWPLSQKRFSDGIWYLPNELGRCSSLKEYLRSEIDPRLIRHKFEEGIEKLEGIDRESDLKMLPYFNDNYQDMSLFTDSWHPSALFYKQVAAYVMRELGTVSNSLVLPNDSQAQYRYRLIFDAVSKELGLRYDQTILPFHGHQISREVFYEFTSFLADVEASTLFMSQIPAMFETWCQKHHLGTKMVDVAPLGVAAQSTNSEWSHENDAQRAVLDIEAPDFAFHTGFEDSPWWQIDLRDFRKIYEIKVYNRGFLRDRALPLGVMMSIDGTNWSLLATINYPFDSWLESAPLDLKFSRPILARFIRLQVDKASYLHLRKVSVFTNAITYD